MKTKNLLLTGLLTLGVLTACSNEDDLGTTTDNLDGKAYTQIAFSIANSASTRAGNVPVVEGNDNEYTASTATILFVQNGTIVEVKSGNLTPGTSTGTNGNTKVYLTEKMEVAPGTYKIYALVNYSTSMGGNFVEDQSISSTTTLTSTAILNGNDDSFPYAKSKEFLMTNTEEPTEVKLTSSTSENDVQEITIDVERIVSKVTTTEQTAISFDLENHIKAELVGVDLINLNTKTYLIKQKMTDFAYQFTTGQPYYTEYSDLYYVSDPNMSKIATASTEFAHPSYNAEKAVSVNNITSAKFYTLENTMDAEAQQNGQTTGLRYKVQYTLNNSGTTAFANASALTTEQQALLPNDLAEDFWKAADGQSEDEEKTFYSYKDYVFRNKNALAAYIAATKQNASADDVKTACTSGTIDSSLKENKDYQKFTAGIAYYSAWIKHNPFSEQIMEKGRYGMVRNHWYNVTVELKNLGSGSTDTEDPGNNDDPDKANIKILVKIIPWRYINQNVEL